jgi:hypothetical protein
MRFITTFVVLAVSGVLGVLAVKAVIDARRSGNRLVGKVVVRCRDGHLFTTIWIPGGSFKAIRLGFIRLQYCPVGDHWTFVTPVPDSDLTDRERMLADLYHDGPIP